MKNVIKLFLGGSIENNFFFQFFHKSFKDLGYDLFICVRDDASVRWVSQPMGLLFYAPSLNCKGVWTPWSWSIQNNTLITPRPLIEAPRLFSHIFLSFSKAVAK